MKLKKNLLKAASMLLSTAFLFSMVSTFAAESGGEAQANNQPYDYPVKLGTPEWRSFHSRVERLAACHVEEALLKTMTTQALVETVLNYPMLADMYAFNSIEEGIERVSIHFAGINELAGRSDAVECLNRYSASIQAGRSVSEITPRNIEVLKNHIENSTDLFVARPYA